MAGSDPDDINVEFARFAPVEQVTPDWRARHLPAIF